MDAYGLLVSAKKLGLNVVGVSFHVGESQNFSAHSWRCSCVYPLKPILHTIVFVLPVLAICQYALYCGFVGLQTADEFHSCSVCF